MVDVLCLGEPLVEFNEQQSGTYARNIGGDVSNVAVAIARQGGRAGMLTKMGEDSFAKEILRLWQAEGVAVQHILRDSEAPTGIYFVSHGPSGHVFDYRRAGSASSRLSVQDLQPGSFEGVKILHLSGISLAISDQACDAALQAIEMAQTAGALISFDTNLRMKLWSLSRARAMINHVAQLCDLLLPSLDDAKLLTGLEEPNAVIDYFLRGQARAVALTLGAEGVLLGTQDGLRARIPSHPVPFVDATAAGDCFDGAFLSEWLRTEDLVSAARFGNAAAALSVQQYGAVPSLPTRTQTQALIDLAREVAE